VRPEFEQIAAVAAENAAEHVTTGRGPTRREIGVVCAGFTILTVVLTYPQAFALSSRVGFHYDALFSIWRLAWIAHQLRVDPMHLFDANIFYPASNTLAFSDAVMLPSLLAAPAIWAGASPVVVYNVLVLLSFVTAGVAMYFFVRSINLPKVAAALAGAAFAFNAYRFAHFPQLELLWTCWIPLALWSFHRAIATRRARDGALLGLFVACQALSCLYYAVFLVTGLIVLSCVSALQVSRRDLRSMWKPALAAGIVCVLIVAPYAIPYTKGVRAVGERSIEDVRNWSPPLASYLAVPESNWWYDKAPAGLDPIEKALFPGFVIVALAVVGVISRPRKYAVLYGILAVVVFDLSLGLNGVTYRYVFDTVWLYRGLRVPGRMFVMLSAGLSVLAAMGVTRVAAWPRWGPHAAFALLLLSAVEAVSIPLPLAPIPRPAPKVESWLAQQPRIPIAEWPWPRADNLGLTSAPIYMYRSTFHWQPLVNGYSGNYTEGYIGFLDATRDFPARQAVRHLQDMGVRYILVHSQPDPAGYADVVRQIAGQPALLFQFAENLGDEEIAVYLLRPDGAQ
jgi:hypothetical protein